MTWPVRKIDDVAIFLNSRRVPVKAGDRAKRQGPYPYYGASGIVDWVDDYIFDGEYLLISEDGENLRSRNAPIAFMARGKYWVNNHAHILDEREPGVLRYLSWALNRTDLSPYITGAAQPKLNKRTLSDVEIPIPPLAERLEINGVLGTLDDKIELNRRMSATLEEMARALYRSWFVDFDPVHARALGQSPAHMDRTTAALFPDSFGPDGLPKGWEMRSIYDFARVQYGAAFKSSLFNTKSDGRPLVRIRDLKNHSAGVHTTEAHKKEHLIQPGDTVVGMDGDFTAYSWCNEPALMNQRVCSFLPKEAENRSFVRHGIVPLLKSEEEAAVATTVIHLGKKDIDNFLLPDPGAEILEAFSSIVEPLTDRFVRLGLESVTLAALRDTLLPRLMSGELRIREAETQIEEVV